MYGDDAEFQTLVSNILNRLAEIEHSAHASAPVVEERPPEPESSDQSTARMTAEVSSQPEPQIEKTQSLPSLDEGVEAAEFLSVQPSSQVADSTETIAAPGAALPAEPETLSTATSAPETEHVKPSSTSQGSANVLSPPTKEVPSRKEKGRKKANRAEPRASVTESEKNVRPVPPALPQPAKRAVAPFSKYYLYAAGIAVVLIVVVVLIKGQFSSSPKSKPATGGESAAIKTESPVSGPSVPSTEVTRPAESKPEKQPESTEPISAPQKRTAIQFVGAPAATIVKIDGKLVGQINPDGGLIHDLEPGTHNFELLRQGYQPLHLRQKVAANHVASIGPKQLLFQPTPVTAKSSPQGQQPPVVIAKTEPTTVPAVRTPPPAPLPDPAASEWTKIASTHDANVLSDFIRKYPNTAQAVEASRRLDQIRAEASRFAAEKATAEVAAARSSIQQTLSRYAQAYHDRDASAISSVWPGLNKQDLKKIQDSFKAAKSIQMSLRPVSDPEISGDVAQVVCSRSLQYTFPQGEQKPVQDKVSVQLRKQNGLWVIEKVQ